MIKAIVSYELKYWFKQYPIYIYAAIFFLLGFSAMLIGGDILNEQEPDPLGQAFFNAPIKLYTNLFCQLNVLIFFLLPAIFGNALNRDFASNMDKVLYAYPVKSKSYFLGKYIAAGITSIFVVFCLGLGAAIGECMPGLDESFIRPFDIFAYLQIYSLYVIPTVLIIGAMVFSSVALSRNIYAGYLTIILIIVLRMIIRSTLRHPDFHFLAASLDPYTTMTALYSTQEWSITEINSLLLPLKKVVLYNKLVWCALSSLLFVWAYSTFKLEHDLPFKIFKRKFKKNESEPTIQSTKKYSPTDIIYENSLGQKIKTIWSISEVEFKSIIFSRGFLGLILGLAILMVIVIGQVNPDLIASKRPFTQIILYVPMIFYGFVVNLITFIYSGQLVHKARSVEMNQLIDVSISSNWTLMLSKLLTLIKIQFILLFIVMLVGIAIQTFSGFYQFDLAQYILRLFYIALVPHIVWAVVALFVHSILPNQYLGIFLLILAMFGFAGIESQGVKAQVLRFNEFPILQFSDLLGFGREIWTYHVYAVYWLLSASILLIFTYLVWNRGTVSTIKERLKVFSHRFNPYLKAILLLAVISFFSTGFWIHSKTKTANNQLDKEQLNKHKAAKEIELSDYFEINQPSLTGLKLQVDLYPNQRRYEATGTLTYVNKSDSDIEILWLDKKTTNIITHSVNHPHKTIAVDSLLHLTLLELDQALVPGDSINFQFELKSPENTLFKVNSEVQTNGCFIMPDFPGIGIADFRLKDSVMRKSLALPQLSNSQRYPEDSLSLTRSYVHSDFLDYEAIVSTASDQRAFTSGTLVDDWLDDDRHYYQYKSKGKVRNGFIFQSGRFGIFKEAYKGKNLEIHHHPQHMHNLESMMEGMKATIDFCEKYYAPYQFDAMRIIEFPQTYGNFAQSFANTIAYSEIAGFLNNIDTTSTESWDSPFRLTTHEMSHQWWGHQVVPADALGSKFITEGSADYVAAKIMGLTKGELRKQNLLEASRLIYFRSRKNAGQEAPLIYVPMEQTFVAYQKGSLALNAISSYLGGDKLDQAMGRYFKAVKFQEAPYTSSIEFIDSIKAVTPDSLQYLVSDYLTKVILYDNKILAAKVESINENQFKLNLELQISKYENHLHQNKVRQNNNGISAQAITIENQLVESLPLKDYIYLGVYAKDSQGEEKLAHYQAYRFDEIRNNLSILLTKKPTKVVIDPKLLLLDQNIEDNVKSF